MISARWRSTSRGGQVAEDAEGAGVGVDQAGRDAGSRGEAEVVGGFGVRGPRSVAIGVAVGGLGGAGEEVGEADGGEEVGLPAGGLVGEVGPFAGEGALRAGGVAGGAPGEEVGEVEGEAGAGPGGGEVAFQPHQLRDLHLRGHGAAGVVEDAVAGGGAFLGLRGGAVVEPEDGVAAVVAGGRDGDRAAVAVEEDEGAGGVEGEAGDRARGGRRPRRGRRGGRWRRLAKSGRRTARRGRRAGGCRAGSRRGRGGGRRRRRCRRGRWRCRRRWRRRGASSGRFPEGRRQAGVSRGRGRGGRACRR